MEGCKAKEEAFDVNLPQMDSNAVTFILILTATGVRSALIESEATGRGDKKVW